MIFYCLQGDHAFKSDEEVVSKEVEIKNHVSEDCEDFLKKLLVKDVGGRLTFKDCLSHPWLLKRSKE